MMPTGFVIQELVTPAVFAEKGESAIELIDPRILKILAQLRADFGPLIVNTWHKGGDLQYRGHRPDTCTVGAMNSWHKKGMAVDCHSPKIPVETMRKAVIMKAATDHPVYSLIGGIELGVNWLHVDVRPRLGGKVKVFRP